MGDVIVATGLGKRFARYHTDRPKTLKEAFLRRFRWMKPEDRFWALRDVGFSVSPGRMLGIIGRNGSGKSTLLRLIGGVMLPDEGQVTVNGHIGGLIHLGAGSHADLTGRENIFINGIVAGLTRREVERRFDSIVDFAELEAVLDSPLRTYSTGLKMRLGFSVAIHTEPDILLIDEVLVVGDLAFQRKCLDRIGALKAQGCAIVFVSHSMAEIRRLCEAVLWLRDGRTAAYGEPEVIAGQYETEMSSETRRRTPLAYPDRLTESGEALRVNENRFGSLEMEIVRVRLLDADRAPVTEIAGGSPLGIEITYRAPEPIEAPIASVTISSDEHEACFDTNTDIEGVSLPRLHGEGRLYLHLDRLDLSSGPYYVDVGIYERAWGYAYDYHWHAYPLLVEGPARSEGILSPPRRWEIETAEQHTPRQATPTSRR